MRSVYNDFTSDGRSIKKIYVKVAADFDSTGYMQPRSIIWQDGRIFRIDEVRDYKPASDTDSSVRSDCYTIVIRGEEKHLFFERSNALFRSQVGRWFVEG